MTDMERVVRDLRYLKSFGRVSNNPQITEIAEDAIALLKEQEVVEPKQIGHGWFCGACDALLSIGNEKIVKLCSMCGKPVKWE